MFEQQCQLQMRRHIYWIPEVYQSRRKSVHLLLGKRKQVAENSDTLDLFVFYLKYRRFRIIQTFSISYLAILGKVQEIKISDIESKFSTLRCKTFV